MAELKTKPNDESVAEFLNSVQDEQKRKDSYALIDLMKEITGEEPKMWGSSIIGFGKYHYKYASGHEGDAALIGFSPRKQNFSLYLMAGIEGNDNLLHKLGKHKAGKGCLYIKKLEDVNSDILKTLIEKSAQKLKKIYPEK
ncbi:hypothetical protein BH23BAC1_BH23BAC1_32090 [soil metagenome]